MKVGDLVKHKINKIKTQWGYQEKHGILIEEIFQNKFENPGSYQWRLDHKLFKVLWNNGTIGVALWDYDLEVVSESR